MKHTNKTEISHVEYLQLIGLLVLAKRHNETLLEILKAVIVITGEKDDMGYSGDVVYGDYTADDLIEKLGITVLKPNLQTSPDEGTASGGDV